MKIYIQRNSSKNRSIEILKYAYYDTYKKNIDLSLIIKNECGKPYYDDKFYFNISHSKNYICIAVSSMEVGIDIEQPRTINNKIAQKVLANGEKLINNNILYNWVIKEAYSKYKGLGLQIGFSNIDANQILKSDYLKNISCDNYICFVYSKDRLDDIIYL